MPDNKSVEQPGFQRRSPVASVDSARFIYQAELGRVQCPICGRFALSRNLKAIAIWKAAHVQFCRKPAVPAGRVCA